ncbi:ATP-binding cassette domain-containing protein [Gordonia sp. CPCC 205515]|uniref:ATP-binding cassette domain-containing protein n=1 Tax=Gordonia sp. CPCC 205515 TaxID=3140791 RepID=UPI003AF39F60
MIPGSISVDGTIHAVGDQQRITIGAAGDNDIVVAHPDVLDHHLALQWRDAGWWLVVADPAARVFTGGRQIAEVPVDGSVAVHLGSPALGPALTVVLDTYAPQTPWTGDGFEVSAAPMPRQLAGAPHLQPMRRNAEGGAPIRLDGVATIGRNADNTIVVDDVLASRLHARITTAADGLWIDDLESINGTYVDGQRVERRALIDGNTITIGNSDFVVAGRTLVRGHTPDAPVGGLAVHGVGIIVDGTKELLTDVDVVARPGTLTAVIGPSGAGKSTVAKIIAGLTVPTSGSVTFEGRDVHAGYAALRTRIGMVPQQDVLHGKLTLRQALRYAAELRLPDDLPGADRDAVIAGVLDELQLTEHLDTRVDTLSGGQRKRASVAMELLTGPALLILDEPTSGLDLALDRQVMSTLRRLADAGRVVVVVTHSLAYLSMCDQVLLLAPGGKTAYLGAPAAVGAAMGTDDWAEIFAFVAAQPDTAYQRYLRGAPKQPPRLRRVVASSPAVPHRSALRQCSMVARRQIRLILADTGYLAVLAVMPIVLGLLTLVIPGSSGFTVNQSTETAGEALQILVILVVGATFMGAALTVRDIVGERDIFERDRAVGLQPGCYLTAKVLVYFAAATLQSLVMVAIAFVGTGLPDGGVLGVAPLELFGAVAALACVSTLVGLAISATVRSTEQTMPPLVIIVVSQLVFCGGLFRLTTPGLEQLSWLFPSYWGYAVAAGAVDLTRIAPLAPQTRQATFWQPELSNTLLGYSALLLMAILLAGYVTARLQLKRPNPAPAR